MYMYILLKATNMKIHSITKYYMYMYDNAD